jgi:RNA polymerase sigma factor (sigma-70 family)
MPHAAVNWLPTRTSLLKRLKDHEDATTWEDFCDSYGRVVYAVALKSGLSPADAEDVTQETLLAVAKRIAGFNYDPSKGSFKSWLLTIARSRIIDCIRRHQRERRFEPPAPEDSSQTSFLARIPDENLPQLDDLYETEWRLGLYESARERVRQRISPQQYQVFDLYVVREWPPEKVASTLELSLNQVYLAKHRVSEAIREEVNRLEAGQVASPP